MRLGPALSTAPNSEQLDFCRVEPTAHALSCGGGFARAGKAKWVEGSLQPRLSINTFELTVNDSDSDQLCG